MNAKIKDTLFNWVMVYKYDIISTAYLIGVCALAHIPITFSGSWFYMFLLFAIPFVNSIEHFFCVVLLLSTIWGYFPGALIKVSSVYTLLAGLIAARAVLNQKPLHPRACPLLILGLLGVTATASWLKSAYSEVTGFVTVILLVIMTALIEEVADFDLEKLTNALSKLAFVLTLWYCICVIVAPSFTRNGRLSIDSSVNVNTFGSSCAMLSVILCISFYFDRKQLWSLAGGAAALILLVLSGSRGALLGFVLACAGILLLDGKRRSSSHQMLFVLFSAAALLLAAALILPLLGITRFSLSHLIHSVGTSDRLHMWTNLLSYLFTSNKWLLGYGPGTACTRRMFLEVMDRNLYHAHNTFLESLGELGLVGFSLTASYVLFSIRNIVRQSRTDTKAYVLLGMIGYILVHGIVESFYQCFFFWSVLALCGRTTRKEIHFYGDTKSLKNTG